jgi:hypothetical protein
MKYSSKSYPYIIAEHKIPLMSAGRQGSPIQVAKGFDMGKRRLLKGVRRGVLSPPSFPDNSGVCYFTQAWLSKATDIVGGKRGYIK